MAGSPTPLSGDAAEALALAQAAAALLTQLMPMFLTFAEVLGLGAQPTVQAAIDAYEKLKQSLPAS